MNAIMWPRLHLLSTSSLPPLCLLAISCLIARRQRGGPCFPGRFYPKSTSQSLSGAKRRVLAQPCGSWLLRGGRCVKADERRGREGGREEEETIIRIQRSDFPKSWATTTVCKANLLKSGEFGRGLGVFSLGTLPRLWGLCQGFAKALAVMPAPAPVECMMPAARDGGALTAEPRPVLPPRPSGPAPVLGEVGAAGCTVTENAFRVRRPAVDEFLPPRTSLYPPDQIPLCGRVSRAREAPRTIISKHRRELRALYEKFIHICAIAS